jgi:NADH-quinone oxidoreductase subunit G
MVELEIDGKKIKVPDGSTIIEASDQAGIYIPRFCYHKKLSIAANCRMCLVEVEKVGKPLPACATPVTGGMIVFTQSPKALEAQRAVMEFLLINHPLDCPICDQGGECELQDLSMGFGRGFSEYSETKRAVSSKDIGALIETEMTRCIHCTRCVRFGEEVAGFRELGVVNRGEHSEITTFVKHFVKSELSGNVVDLCPVGALTNKPARYKGRGWEYREHPNVSPHDCVGSNLYLHSRGRQSVPQRTVMRAVPKENEAINETWLADRDRFSCHGLYNKSRALQPQVKRKSRWSNVGWERALLEIVDRTNAILQNQGAEQIAALASSSSTTEELYLLQKIMRSLGSNNIDHRIRQQDFSDQAVAPDHPGLHGKIADLEDTNAVLLVGSNVRYEQPLIGCRISKAASENDAVIMAINSQDYTFTFPIKYKAIVAPQCIVSTLAEVAKVLADGAGEKIKGLGRVTPTASTKAIATQLKDAESAQIMLGEQAMNHPEAAQIRALSQAIAKLSQAKVSILSDGANSAGAWLAGAVPHRGAAGEELESIGLTAKELLTTKPVRAYFIFNFEPEHDCAYSAEALAALKESGLVVCFTSFVSKQMKEYADFILPISPFISTAGTYVNAEGRWQSFAAVSVPQDEVKPGWKVLRVLGDFFKLDGFSYKTAHEVQEEIKKKVDAMGASLPKIHPISVAKVDKDSLVRLAPWPMYRVDSLVRHSEPLQSSLPDTIDAIKVNSTTAKKLKLTEGENVVATQSTSQVTLPLLIDEQLADDTVLLPSALEKTAGFGQAEAQITLERGNE